MMKYKLIISDYGETIVKTGNNVDPKNIDAINNYQKLGGIFSIATGREWPSINNKLNKEGVAHLDNMPIICCYGAIVIESKTKKIISDIRIREGIVVKAIEFLSEMQIPYGVVTRDKTLIKSDIDVSSYRWKQYGNLQLFNNDDEIIYYIKKHLISIYKIDIYSNKSIDVFLNFLDINFKNKLKYYPSKNNFSEFVSYGAGKDFAYNYLKKHFSLIDNEIIVVGDALNDMGLFRHSVNKVAVSNAIEELIQESTYIVDNNNYLGISRLIEKVVKGEKI